MEVGREPVGVQREEVRAEGEIERAVSEREVRQLVGPLAVFGEPRRRIGEEAAHGRQTSLAQVFGRPEVAPNEAVPGRPDVGYEGAGGLFYPVVSGVLGGEAVERVTRDDVVARRGGFGVEARGARGAVEDAASEVPRGQGEHPCVLVEGAAPGDHPFELRGSSR